MNINKSPREKRENRKKDEVFRRKENNKGEKSGRKKKRKKAVQIGNDRSDSLTLLTFPLLSLSLTHSYSLFLSFPAYSYLLVRLFYFYFVIDEVVPIQPLHTSAAPEFVPRFLADVENPGTGTKPIVPVVLMTRYMASVLGPP